MTRTRTTLGNLKEGDTFYFPTDKARTTHRCGAFIKEGKKSYGWMRPFYTGRAGADMAKATREVIKIEK